MNITIEKPDLTGYQNDILYCDARFTITEASTKAGKTFSHIWWLFERAHAEWNKFGYNHWWVAPTYSQSKIAYNRMVAVVRHTGLYKTNETSLTITTPIGTVMTFKTAKDPNNLYGEDVYSAVFDEAPRSKHASWVALRSTLTATRAPCKLIGNFGGSSNWMHLLKEKAKTDKEYAYFKVTAWDAVEAGILDEEEILQAQRDLPPKIFKALYLAEEQESDDMLCSYDSMRDVFTNTHAKKGTKYITADIALQGSDKFVVIVWDGWVVIDLIIIDKCDADEVEKLLKSLAEKHSVGRSNIIYDADGLGSFLRGYLKGAIGFNNGGKPIKEEGIELNYKNLKTQCIYKLAQAINRKEIYFQYNLEIETKELLLQEMECLQSANNDDDGKMQAMSKKSIKELIGRSPDILDALMMRMYFTLKKQGKYFA